MYTAGQQIERFGSIYTVERVYSLTDDEMKIHGLLHRNRVTLRKVSGANGSDVYDFALPAEGA